MAWWILGRYVLKLIVPFHQSTLENICNFGIRKKKVLSKANVEISMNNFLNMMVGDEKTPSYRWSLIKSKLCMS